jgi:hypothetical protein
MSMKFEARTSTFDTHSIKNGVSSTLDVPSSCTMPHSEQQSLPAAARTRPSRACSAAFAWSHETPFAAPCCPSPTSSCDAFVGKKIKKRFNLLKTWLSAKASTRMKFLGFRLESLDLRNPCDQFLILLITLLFVLVSGVMYLGIHSVILFAIGMKDPSLLPLSTPCPLLHSSMMPSLYRFLHPPLASLTNPIANLT